MEHYNMNLTLKVWRQKNKNDKGGLETYQVKNISSEMSFLEMFDVLNEQLLQKIKNLLLSITIVVKVFAVCVLCISMVVHTDHGMVQLLANCTCVLLKMVIPL
jgi:hypothetical protein